jgi:hypothetical protein
MPEYWRPFIASFKVEYEGRLSHWKRRTIIFVGHVLYTKMKSFVEGHESEDKVLGICKRSVH